MQILCIPMQGSFKTHAEPMQGLRKSWVFLGFCIEFASDFWRRMGSTCVCIGFAWVLHVFNHWWFKSID
ncbi:hypothetical protein Y032_0002g1083 [Ancylostoma ceylanicum]|uniref:Uncharacterized protein n=1 Tax=Ancylostoma ceylanicum TaxID=53326 RepID=A0A016VZJ8_9BILA|nr:hypothetical protein Y032_0002g1083 [Ancylostoma ceylanicum]